MLFQIALAALFMASLGVVAEADDSERDNTDSSFAYDSSSDTYEYEAVGKPDRKYDVLLVRERGNNGSEAVNPKTGEVVFRTGKHRRFNFELIEWALHSARVTAVLEGTYKLHTPINVSVPNTNLIVGPDVKISWDTATHTDEGTGLINITRLDNVRVFNMGTLDSNQSRAAVYFDGRHGGEAGINGGMLFATGSTINRGGYWLVDTANMNVPFIWERDGSYGAVLVPEGSEDLDIGTAIGLALEDSRTALDDYDFWKAHEVVDVQPRNIRTHIHEVITSFTPKMQEAVDINNAPYTTIDKIVGYTTKFGDADAADHIGVKKQLVDIHTYDSPHMRRLTQKPYEKPFIANSPGTVIKDAKIVNKDVKEWKTTVKTPGFPDKLPVLRVNIKLTAVFEDGSKEEVFRKKYKFDL